MKRSGGRHYSDRLFRQTLFRQSTVRTTQYIFSTLGICRNLEKTGLGRGVGFIESTALMEALRWLRGAEPGKGIPVGLGCPSPPPDKLQRTSNTIVGLLPLIFGIWFPICTARIGLFNCSQPPDIPTMDCRTRNSVCRNSVCRNSVVYPKRSCLSGIIVGWKYVICFFKIY